MGKIGAFDFPDIKFSRALEICQRICEPPYRGEISRSGLASDLEMKESGGAFYLVVSSLKGFRLVEGRETLKVTDLAKRIFTGSSNESEKAKAEAFLDVPLFQTLSQRLDGSVPDEAKFRVILGEITKEDPLKIKTLSKSLMKAYSDGPKHFEASTHDHALTATRKDPSTPIETPSTFDFIEVRAGPYYQKLPYDSSGVKIAIDFLHSLSASLASTVQTDSGIESSKPLTE